MKEEQFFKELKARDFDYSEPSCETHYGKNLFLKSTKLAYVRGYGVTTTKITYWIRFPASLDEHIFGFVLEGFHGPDAGLSMNKFTEILNSLNLKEAPREKIPRPRPGRLQVVMR